MYCTRKGKTGGGITRPWAFVWSNAHAFLTRYWGSYSHAVCNSSFFYTLAPGDAKHATNTANSLGKRRWIFVGKKVSFINYVMKFETIIWTSQVHATQRFYQVPTVPNRQPVCLALSDCHCLAGEGLMLWFTKCNLVSLLHSIHGRISLLMSGDDFSYLNW